MGITFIGNPFDQDNDYYDSDWEVNMDEELVRADFQLVDVMDRAQFNVVLAAGAESSGEDSDPNWLESNNDEDDSDEDYQPEDEYASETDMIDGGSETDYYGYNDSDDYEDIDYVDVSHDAPAEADKVTTNDGPNTSENNDTD
ncbi:hypothetical protein NQ318_015086 [Aromia moschata]|uniref:Uncharacterized protein n=1 Tax=Aromia moschata TaxID=1265417 RepID=A0AAV8YWA1_9CUCU|nr:hypothetical protein NQ318_015086 [Aromia moschata]